MVKAVMKTSHNVSLSIENAQEFCQSPWIREAASALLRYARVLNANTILVVESHDEAADESGDGVGDEVRMAKLFLLSNSANANRRNLPRCIMYLCLSTVLLIVISSPNMAINLEADCKIVPEQLRSI